MSPVDFMIKLSFVVQSVHNISVQNIYDKTNVKRKVYCAYKYVINNGISKWKDQETLEGQKKATHEWLFVSRGKEISSHSNWKQLQREISQIHLVTRRSILME